MTDQSISLPRARTRARSAEYNVYFALIFVLGLPFAVLGWAGSALRHRRLPAKGPIRRALCEARLLAPMIFTA